MKKNLKILILPIISLIGLGFSFGYQFRYHYVDYTNLSSNSSFSIRGYYDIVEYFSSPTSSYGISPVYRYDSNIISFDLSKFYLSTNLLLNYADPLKLYYNSNGNRLLGYYRSSQNAYGSYLIPLTSTFDGLSSEDLISNTNYGTYTRIFSSDSNCFESNVMFDSGGFCNPNYVQIFSSNPYTITSQGNVYDSSIDGVNYLKGPVSSSIDKGYSFGFLDGSGWVKSGNIYSISSGYHFRSIYYDGSNIKTLNNILIYKLNSQSPISYDSTEDYKVIVLALSDDDNIVNSYGGIESPVIYSIYNCPYNSTNIFQCSFIEGGKTNKNFSTVFNSSNPNSIFSYYITYSFGMKLYNVYSESNNTITLYRYLGSDSSRDDLTSLSISLDSSLGYDIIGEIPNPDVPSGGIVDDVSIINTCEDIQTSQNVIDNCVNQYGTGSSFYSCVISNCIQTNKTGSSVTIYDGDGSGSYFTIEYGGQTFTFYTTQSGFVDNSGLNLDMSSLNIALGYKSGLLTTGLVIDMLDNLTGWIGKCPFPYTDFQLGQNSNILKALKLGGFDYDPFIPINCFVAGWDYGRHYFSNNRIDTHFDGPILKGNNNEYKSLYMFFDFIIILFLISFAHFIKKLF